MSSKKVTNKHESNPQADSKRKKVLLIAAAVMLGLWLVTDLIGFGGNIRFYTKWAQCGEKPTVVDFPWPAGAGVPYYYSPNAFELVRLSPPQFCTALEAELHGYSVTREYYELPVIKEDRGRACRYPGEPESQTAVEIPNCTPVDRRN